MIMMRQLWVGDESVDELVKINDESVISRWWIGNESGDELWKSMMSWWLVGENRWCADDLVLSWVMSRCLSEIHGFLDTKEEFFP